MGKRKKIGIIFTYSENWIGGTYYISNIIESLKTQPPSLLPTIVFLISNTQEIDFLKKINYPFAEYIILGKNSGLARRILNKLTFNQFQLTSHSKILALDLLFPFNNYNFFLSKVKRKLNWIPDFQEKYLPHFFDQPEIEARRREHNRIAENEEYVVFSSKDALKDFDEFYPNATVQKFVLNFAATHPEYQHLNIKDLLKKYNISKKYFFSPNQFWVHKNHSIILKAAKYLKDENKLDFQIVFSGKEFDFRSLGYTESLKQYVDENNMQDNVKFLGFIDRNEQLQLMNYAEAIIQPSLFEGWSTVIEDAKAMNQCIIASQINVHKEQLENNQAHFFDPKNHIELSEKILTSLTPDKIKYNKNYRANVHKFGKDFLKISNTIIGNKNIKQFTK